MGEGTVSGAPGGVQSAASSTGGHTAFPVPFAPTGAGVSVSTSTNQPLTDGEIAEIQRIYSARLAEQYPHGGGPGGTVPTDVLRGVTEVDDLRRQYDLPVPGKP
jgi:hypothetical protein